MEANHQRNDFGLVALTMLAQYHNISLNPEEIKHKFDLDGKGLSLTAWLLAAKSLALKAKHIKKRFPAYTW